MFEIIIPHLHSLSAHYLTYLYQAPVLGAESPEMKKGRSLILKDKTYSW